MVRKIKNKKKSYKEIYFSDGTRLNNDGTTGKIDFEEMPVEDEENRLNETFNSVMKLENQEKIENELTEEKPERLVSFEKFDLTMPKKSDFFEVKKAGQSDKIEKSNHRLSLRISDTENQILTVLKERNEDFNISEFIKKLILGYDRQLTKAIVLDKYYENLEELKNLKEKIASLNLEYKKIKTLRGLTQEEAQKLVNVRKKILFEKDTIEKRINLINEFLEKYKPFFQK